MTTATATDVRLLETEIGELIAAYRECQTQVKAWEHEQNFEVRPVLERKLAERGTDHWECEYGRARYVDAKGQVDWEAAYFDMCQQQGVPFEDAIRIKDYYRKQPQRRFEVRAPLKLAPSHDNDDLAPALEASVTALAGKDST